MTHVSLYLPTTGASWEDACDQVELAEVSGFRAVWFMDNTSEWAGAPADTARFDPWSLIPALATYTNRISLGTMGSCPGQRHPVVAACQIATIDRISDGRVELTVCAGDEVTSSSPPFAQSADSKVSQMLEELSIMRSLWENERTDFEGHHFSVSGETCEPKPEWPIPVWMQLAWGRASIPRAIAAHAYGYTVAPYAANHELVARQIQSVRDACTEIGRSPLQLRSSRVVGVTLTDDEVDPDDAKRGLLAGVDPQTRRLLDKTGPATIEFLARSWPEFAPTEYRFEDYFEVSEFHCVGTPEQVADQILSGTRDLGIEEAVIWPYGRLRSWEPDCVKTQGDMIERIAKELVPLLRRAR